MKLPWPPPPRRAEATERLDLPHLDPVLLAASLADVSRVNRWLGGTRALRRDLRALLPAGSAPRRLRVLDVGTGAADVPLILARWGRALGIVLEVEAIDLHPQVVAIARRRTAGTPGIKVRRADARALPYPPASFDVAISTLTLHHLAARDAAVALREMARVSRIGFVVSDLLRCWANLAAARALAAAVWRNPITRHDGPLSVLRSHTLSEWRAILAEAGVPGRVRASFPFRVSIVGCRDGARGT